MGLWDILTKEIKLGSHELSWNEPMMCRTRLRGDLIWRVVISLSVWLAVTGIMLLIFASNQNPPSRGVALGLGLIFGLVPAVMVLFMRKSQSSGTIKLFRDRLERTKMYVGLMSRWTQNTTWGLGGIARFHLVTADKVGQSFHVLFFKCDGEWDYIGIPRKIDLKKLASLLSAGGAEVKPTNKLPDTFQQSLSPVLAGVSGVVGVALALTGFLVFNPGNGVPRPDFAQNRPEFPQPDFGNPGPINPGGAFPDLPQDNNRDINDNLPNPADDFPNPGGFPAPGGFPPGNPFGANIAPEENTIIETETPAAELSVDEKIGFRSKLVGGTGGFPFTQVSAQLQPTVGVRCRMGTWADQKHLAAVTPLFERARPNPRPNESVIITRPGYALGAVEIHAPEFVDGLRLVFMKQAADGSLDVNDSYKSDWIGISSADPIRLDHSGAPIIGFHGKGGAVLDALGVVFRE